MVLFGRKILADGQKCISPRGAPKISIGEVEEDAPPLTGFVKRGVLPLLPSI